MSLEKLAYPYGRLQNHNKKNEYKYYNKLNKKIQTKKE